MPVPGWASRFRAPGAVALAFAACAALAGPAVARERCVTADLAGVAMFPVPCARGHEGVDGAMVMDAGGTSVVVGQFRLRQILVTGSAPVAGGLEHTFTATLEIKMQGNGSFLGYQRTVSLPASGRLFATEQIPGANTNTITTEVLELIAAIPPGDTHFDALVVTAGTAFGFPGTGLARATRLPAGDWALESSIDLLYKVDYDTTPTSVFAGLVGTITSQTLLRDGTAPRHPYGAPDVGGTAVFPPACDGPPGGFGFRSQWFVPALGSMPAGSPVVADVLMRNYVVTAVTPGGEYGGTTEDWSADMELSFHGTGIYGSYRRTVTVPVTGRTQTGAHGAGGILQGFPADVIQFDGQILGDPDFDMLRVKAGVPHGLPVSVGHATLRASGGGWLVDSFFDLTFRIEFTGAPGGPFAGRTGGVTNREMLLVGGPDPEPLVVPDLAGTARYPLFTATGYRSGPSVRVASSSLPAGSALLGDLTLQVTSVTESNGGTLGGKVQSVGGSMLLDLTGTGAYSSYVRTIVVPFNGQTSTAPRMAGTTPQSFETEWNLMFGQIMGDPQFDLLRIQAGTSFGMAGPGHTVLHSAPPGWLADSHIDLTYQVEFIGSASGPFAGIHSITRSRDRFQAGASQTLDVPAGTGSETLLGTPRPNPARGASRIALRLARTADIESAVYDLGGRRVAQIGSMVLGAGTHDLNWDGRDAGGRGAPAGLYFYRVLVDGVPFTSKLVLAR